MTIKGLSKFMKDKGVPQFFTPNSFLEFVRIAIDGNSLCHNRLYGVKNQVIRNYNFSISRPTAEDFEKPLINSIVSYLFDFISHRCIPIMVFDGKPPALKSETLEKRYEESKSKYEEFEELSKELDRCYEQGIIPDDDSIERYKNIYRNNIKPGRTFFSEVAETIKALGIPVLYSLGEGDGLCASLVMEGYCYAAMSTDRDILVHGCPRLICDFSKSTFKGESGHLCTLLLESVLDKLNMSFDMFKAFCIRCGCDYNTRVWRVGPSSIYKLIQKDELDDPFKYPALNYQACMELFRPRHVDELYDKSRSSDVIDIVSANIESPMVKKYDLGHIVPLIEQAKNDIDSVVGFHPTEELQKAEF